MASVLRNCIFNRDGRVGQIVLQRGPGNSRAGGFSRVSRGATGRQGTHVLVPGAGRPARVCWASTEPESRPARPAAGPVHSLPAGDPVTPSHAAAHVLASRVSERWEERFDSHADLARGSHAGGRRGLLAVSRMKAWRWPLLARPSEIRPCHTSPPALPRHTQRNAHQPRMHISRKARKRV